MREGEDGVVRELVDLPSRSAPPPSRADRGKAPVVPRDAPSAPEMTPREKLRTKALEARGIGWESIPRNAAVGIMEREIGRYRSPYISQELVPDVDHTRHEAAMKESARKLMAIVPEGVSHGTHGRLLEEMRRVRAEGRAALERLPRVQPIATNRRTGFRDKADDLAARLQYVRDSDMTDVDLYLEKSAKRGGLKRDRYDVGERGGGSNMGEVMRPGKRYAENRRFDTSDRDPYFWSEFDRRYVTGPRQQWFTPYVPEFWRERESMGRAGSMQEWMRENRPRGWDRIAEGLDNRTADQIENMFPARSAGVPVGRRARGSDGASGSGARDDAVARRTRRGGGDAGASGSGAARQVRRRCPLPKKKKKKTGK